MLGGPDAVRIEAQTVARQRLRECAVALELVAGWEHAALELVGGESPLSLHGLGFRDELVDGAHFAGSVSGVGVAEEQVRREPDLIAQRATENCAHRHAPRLPHEVQARELHGGEHLGPQVVQRGGRVGNEKAQFLDARGVAPDEIRLESVHRGARAFAAPAQLTETDEARVGLDLDDRAHEAAPVTPVRMAEGCFEGNRDRRRANVGDLHGDSDKLT